MTVQRFREYACRGRFTYTAHPGEQERVREAILLNRARERAGDGLLAYEVFEDLGPIFERQYFVRH